MKAGLLTRLGLAGTLPVGSRPAPRLDPCPTAAVEPRERVELAGFLPPLPARASPAPELAGGAASARPTGPALADILAPHTTQHIMRATLHEAADPSLDFLVSGAGTSRLDPHLKKHFPGLGLITSLCLACTVMGAVLPGAAYAQEPTHTTASATIPARSAASSNSAVRALEEPQASAADADTVQLANAYGLNPAVLQRAARDGQTASVLKVLPESLRAMYRELNPEQKGMMVEKLQGTTGFLFIRVSNQEAFINGEAAGYNTFDEMQKMLAEKLQEGKIDHSMFEKLHGAIEKFRTMTPQQRSALVALLEADVQSRL